MDTLLALTTSFSQAISGRDVLQHLPELEPLLRTIKRDIGRLLRQLPQARIVSRAPSRAADYPTASNSFGSTPRSVHEDSPFALTMSSDTHGELEGTPELIDRPSQRGGKRRRCDTVVQLHRRRDTHWQLSVTSEHHLPVEAQVAALTCDATVHQCGTEVLARYVAHLVEQDTISPLASEKINALLGSTLHDGNSLFQQASCLLHTSGTNDADLVNLCEESKTRLFQHLVQQCADQYMCQHCSDHVHDSTSYPNPCRGVQYLYRLLQHEFEVTQTRLKDCRLIASRTLADCVMLAGPYPNTLKRVAYSLVSVQECVDQSSREIEQSLPRCDLVYFREAFHDAIELGHQYSVSVVEDGTLPGPSNALPQTVVQPFGYLALVHARCEIGRPTCGRVLLVPCGVHHGRSGDRLLAELYTCSEASGHFVSSGVRRVESGLSFPTRGAPRRYTLALETARAERRGVFQYGLEMGAEELSHGMQFLNETHMSVSPSLIKGAGSGLMVRPTPPGRQEVTIPKGAYLCFFANHTPAPEGHPSDYELGSTRRGGARVDVVYDPQVYDGKNIGRFINQGGLLEGIKALVASCDRDQGGDVYQPKVAENIFNQHANVVYTTQRGGQEMVVTAKQDIRTSSDQAIELLANYGLPYWFAFAVRNHLSLGHDSVLVKGVFWLLFSTFSRYKMSTLTATARSQLSKDKEELGAPPQGCKPSSCRQPFKPQTDPPSQMTTHLQPDGHPSIPKQPSADGHPSTDSHPSAADGHSSQLQPDC
eukprot:Em0008g12a